MEEETPEPQITQKPAETAEVAAEIESVEEKPVKSWFKIVLFSILGIILAAGLVFAGYKLAQLKQVKPGPQPTPTPVVVATPTPDPTANWKTYTNTKYGYLVKYPEDGEVVSAKLSEVDMDQEEFSSPQLLIDNRTAALNVVIYENRQNLSLSEFAQTIFKEDVISQKSIIIGEISGYEMVVRGADTDNRYIFLGKDKLILEIFFPTADNPNDAKAKEHFDIFNLMLSTFKFSE